MDDIMAFIAGRIYLRYNVVTGRVECKAPLVPPNWGDDTAQDISSPSGGRPGGGCWTPLNDRIVNSLWKEMSQQQEKVVRVQDMDVAAAGEGGAGAGHVQGDRVGLRA